MTDRLDPTEEYDGTVTVRLLDDDEGVDELTCSSFREAIGKIKTHMDAVTAAKIVDRDDEVVFTSREMNIEDWEREWHRAKRSLSVDIDEHDCPHDNVACFADDRCVECRMDRVQEQFRRAE
ncbi:hypothetical protein [Natranaeroarchaeum sulfidigenes]|nr:hypothetical protein [Natranaeroarchaeum sulfidigenes]